MVSTFKEGYDNLYFHAVFPLVVITGRYLQDYERWRRLMEFHKHQDLWGLLKKTNTRGLFTSKDAFFDAYLSGAEAISNAFAFRRGLLEKDWEKLNRPYYNVFPAIVPMLMSLKLDIPCDMLKSISIQPIEVRLPTNLKDSFLSWDGGCVKSVLFGIQLMPSEVKSNELVEGLCICFDIGELDELGHAVLTFKFFPLRPDKTIEEATELLPAHESLKMGVQIPEHIIMSVVRLCACLALIDSDSDIITPDVLAKHKDKWESASDAEKKHMTDMARRRGKNGWDVGASIEYVPHYRRPHPAIVRIGKGRKLTRIVMRKGSVVHRSKITSIPSGFGLEEA